MGIIGWVARDAAYNIAVNAAVKGAYKGYDALKERGRAKAAPAPVYDAHGNIVPFDDLRVFGTPGASLVTAYELDEGARDAGIQGEQRVAQELERLAAHYPNMYVFHSVKLPGEVGDIDHLVVQGDKMMLVDSKNWKSDATYHVYAADEDGDYISRNGENFVGGEIHLRRQTADWQHQFRRANLRVNATLVIANRRSTVSEAVNAPYFFANLDGLDQIFGAVFYQAAVPPMHPVLLNQILSMVDTIDGPMMLHPNFVSAQATKPQTTTKTKMLVGWSIFNWTVMWLLFIIAGVSAIPLLIVTHRHRAQVAREGLGGKGLLTAVLVWTYLQLVLWVPMTIFTVFHIR